MRNAEKEIAVRGFMNEKFGTTFGKGLFHRAIYNGSVELRDPNTKYLIDLFPYDHWEAKAKSDEQMAWVKKLQNTDINKSSDVLVSWVQHYDPFTKSKTMVDGVCVYMPETSELYISINDSEHGTCTEWELPVAACKNTGPKKPVFIASNVDVGNW